jgi:hypothetical protein
MLEEYQNNGVNIPTSIYRRVKKGTFKKVLDTKLYLIDTEASNLIFYSFSINDKKSKFFRSR